MSKFRFRHSKRQKPPREIPLRAMVPNLITMSSAAAGITAIRYSCQSNWRLAVIYILAACLMDGLDGGVARMLHATSKLGAQLDSLADFVSFGVAPALFIYFWVMDAIDPGTAAYSVRGIFWGFALFYAMCCAFRLARFNIMIETPPVEPYWKYFFTGLPAPAGAGLMILLPIWQLETGWNEFQSPWLGGSALIIGGILMASRFPTLCLKKIRIPVKSQLPFVLLILFTIGMFIAHTWLTLGCVGFVLIASVPICGIVFLRLKHNYQRHNANALPPSTPKAPEGKHS